MRHEPSPAIAHMLPAGATVLTLDDIRLPDGCSRSAARYLDKLNFATNFAFFRDADGLHTRLVSANYWASYGAGRRSAVAASVRRRTATILATWEQTLPAGPGGFSIDSQAGAGALRAGAVHRPVVHPCHRRRRAMTW